jgi:Flp pilus assembly protein TadD
MEAAARRAPGDPRTAYNLALLNARAGRIEEARRLAMRALELDPASLPTRALIQELSRP